MRTKSDWGKALRRAGKETSKAFFTGKTIGFLVKEAQKRKWREQVKFQKEQIKSLKRQQQLRMLRAKEEAQLHPFRQREYKPHPVSFRVKKHGWF